MIIIWWIVMIIFAMSHGMRLHALNIYNVTLAGVLSEIVSALMNAFLLYTSYQYIIHL